MSSGTLRWPLRSRTSACSHAGARLNGIKGLPFAPDIAYERRTSGLYREIKDHSQHPGTKCTGTAVYSI
eukprot:2509110-Rhodomonas_salina.2